MKAFIKKWKGRIKRRLPALGVLFLTVLLIWLAFGKSFRSLLPLIREGNRDAIVTADDLEQMVGALTEYSRYASMETLRRGYLSVRGGFRRQPPGGAVGARPRVGLFYPMGDAPGGQGAAVRRGLSPGIRRGESPDSSGSGAVRDERT